MVPQRSSWYPDGRCEFNRIHRWKPNPRETQLDIQTTNEHPVQVLVTRWISGFFGPWWHQFSGHSYAREAENSNDTKGGKAKDTNGKRQYPKQPHRWEHGPHRWEHRHAVLHLGTVHFTLANVCLHFNTTPKCSYCFCMCLCEWVSEWVCVCVGVCTCAWAASRNHATMPDAFECMCVCTCVFFSLLRQC